MRKDLTTLQMKQVEEGVARMRALGILYPAIREFKSGKLNLSEFGGILYWLNETEQEIVSGIEKEYGLMVYHVIKTPTEFGLCYSMLYVSAHEEEWEQDRADLAEGYPIAYVYNATAPDYSEFGSIGVKPSVGGVKRTA